MVNQVNSHWQAEGPCGTSTSKDSGSDSYGKSTIWSWRCNMGIFECHVSFQGSNILQQGTSHWTLVGLWHNPYSSLLRYAFLTGSICPLKIGRAYPKKEAGSSPFATMFAWGKVLVLGNACFPWRFSWWCQLVGAFFVLMTWLLGPDGPLGGHYFREPILVEVKRCLGGGGQLWLVYQIGCVRIDIRIG